MLVSLAGDTMMLGWQGVTPSTEAGGGDIGRGVIGVGIDLIDWYWLRDRVSSLWLYIDH